MHCKAFITITITITTSFDAHCHELFLVGQFMNCEMNHSGYNLCIKDQPNKLPDCLGSLIFLDTYVVRDTLKAQVPGVPSLNNHVQ